MEYVEKALRDGLSQVANAITPLEASACNDDFGGHVESLTEAVLSVSCALKAIADAINNLAEKK